MSFLIYFLIIILVPIWAQFKVRSAYKKYSQVSNSETVLFASLFATYLALRNSTMSGPKKFGGSSVASAEKFKQVAHIVTSDKERKLVVVSAPGKRYGEDTKMTDLLIALSAKIQLGEDYVDEFGQVSENTVMTMYYTNSRDRIKDGILLFF